MGADDVEGSELELGNAVGTSPKADGLALCEGSRVGLTLVVGDLDVVGNKRGGDESDGAAVSGWLGAPDVVGRSLVEGAPEGAIDTLGWDSVGFEDGKLDSV